MEFLTKGLVINEAKQGESDKLLTILTQTRGKIYALAKGVKKLTGKNSAGCQLFAYSEFEFVEKGGRYIVKNAVPTELFFNIRDDISRYALACYFVEVACHVTVCENDETQTLRLMLNVLFALSNMKDVEIWKIKGAFEMRLMALCGFMPDVGGCFSCGKEAERINNGRFSFDEATVLCDDCAKKTNLPFSCSACADVLRAVYYVCNCRAEKLLSFNIDPSYALEFSFLCENYLIHKTERTYKTLKVYKSVVNSLGEL